MKKFLLGLAFLFSGFSYAGLIGNEINFQCPECGPPYDQSFTALAGVAEISPFDQWHVDVEDSSLKITWLSDFPSVIDPAHFVFSWDALDFSIGNAVLDISSSLAYDFIFSANSVNIDIGGIAVSAGDFVLINLVSDASPEPVPEPGAFALILLGLAGVGYSRKKRAW